MGWNEGFTIMEATVIGAYDLGKLDRALLDVLMTPYANSDIDEGGRLDLETKDGKGIYEVVLETFGLGELDLDEVPKRPNAADDDDVWDEYWEVVHEAFAKIAEHYDW